MCVYVCAMHAPLHIQTHRPAPIFPTRTIIIGSCCPFHLLALADGAAIKRNKVFIIRLLRIFHAIERQEVFMPVGVPCHEPENAGSQRRDCAQLVGPVTVIRGGLSTTGISVGTVRDLNFVGGDAGAFDDTIPRCFPDS